MTSSRMSAALRRLSQGALAGVLVAGLAATALAAPKAVLVEPRQQDLGEVEPDKVQHLTYTLRNDGDAPLLIAALEPVCYCTTVKADANEIAPGATTSLHVTIDPSDFVGNITKGFEMTTNDPQESKVMVEVALKVRPGLAARTSRLFSARTTLR